MELTKEYFTEQLRKLFDRQARTFATKRDLENLATKDDLLELATKSDLGAVGTAVAEVNEAVQQLDRRDDQDIRAIARDVAGLKKRVSALER
jgi:fumarate hydratase class II